MSDAPDIPGVPAAGDAFFRRGLEATEVMESGNPAAGIVPEGMIGEFLLIRRLGRGGMGEVWEALQTSLDRRVALKLLLPGRVSEKAVRYFAREARAGGRIHHPGIVGVYGTGEQKGLHWIAMELVEGGATLAGFVDQMRSEADLPGDYYSRVAEFVAKVADALQAAHAEGVIHRDLKPLNILVQPDGEPKVGDFGLARVADEHSLSQTGDFAGTYYYMSPEQVMARRMGIDLRTDVFSLGVVLYEMLALQRPFEGDTTHQIAQKIVMEEPPRIRALRSRVPDDLVVICDRALEKSPESRYQSMEALAADLRRHLADESILAKPPTALRRASKWARRNPTKSAVGGVLALALVATSWLGLLAMRSAALATERAEDLVAANLDLKVRTREAQEARFAAQAVSDYLEEILYAAAPSTELGRGRDVTLREVLDANAEKLEEQFVGNPESEARIRTTLGVTYMELGEPDLADPHLRRALVLREEMLPEEHEDLLNARSNVGGVLIAQGKLAEAEPVFQEVLEIRRLALGEDHLVTLKSSHDLAYLLGKLGRLDEAEQITRRVLAGRRSKLGDDDPETLRTINNLGAFLEQSNRPEEAERYFREALEGYRRVRSGDHPDTLNSLGNLGASLRAQGRLTEAESYLQEALEASRRVLGDTHDSTLVRLANMGKLRLAQGRTAEGESLMRESMEGFRKVFGDDHPDTLTAIHLLGVQLSSMGRFEDAEPYLLEALKGRRSALGDRHYSTLDAIVTVGNLHHHRNELDEAEVHYREALEGRREIYGEEHSYCVSLTIDLGEVLHKKGDRDDAEELFRGALKIAHLTLGEGHAITFEPLHYLGTYALNRKEFDQAESHLGSALAIVRRDRGDDDPSTLATIYYYLVTLRDLGRLAEAETLARELTDRTPETDPNLPAFKKLLDSILSQRAEVE